MILSNTQEIQIWSIVGTYGKQKITKLFNDSITENYLKEIETQNYFSTFLENDAYLKEFYYNNCISASLGCILDFLFSEKGNASDYQK